MHVSDECLSNRNFLASFQKFCPGIKTPRKVELIILGSPLGPKTQEDLLEKKKPGKS